MAVLIRAMSCFDLFEEAQESICSKLSKYEKAPQTNCYSKFRLISLASTMAIAHVPPGTTSAH